jgi:hypothetical protein
MPFEQLKSSVEKYFKMATDSEPFDAVQKRASAAGAAIADKAASISQSVSDLISTQKPVPEGEEAGNDVAANYESLSALKPLQKLVSEAGIAINDKTRTLLDSDIPELLGAVGGVGAGVAAGAGIMSVSAGSGLAGGAALTSGLATAGSLVGGGMIAGIGVVAAPAVVLGAAGVWAVGRYNKNKLFEAKETLLQEALRKRDALLSELHATNSLNHERVSYLSSLVAQLQAAVENLQSDIIGGAKDGP